MKQELYDKLVCALTHSLTACDTCKKCPGATCADIRIQLVEELAKAVKKPTPWVDDQEDVEGE